MKFVLRAWVKDKLEETLETANREQALRRFRDIVSEWPQDWAHVRWFVTVIDETNPYPAQSIELAKYQHVAVRKEG